MSFRRQFSCRRHRVLSYVDYQSLDSWAREPEEEDGGSSERSPGHDEIPSVAQKRDDSGRERYFAFGSSCVLPRESSSYNWSAARAQANRRYSFNLSSMATRPSGSAPIRSGRKPTASIDSLGVSASYLTRGVVGGRGFSNG